VTPRPQPKIAYVLTFDPSIGSGLWLRMQERLEVWRGLGISVDVFICCRKSSSLVLAPPIPGHRIHLLTGSNPFLASFSLPRRLALLNPDLIYMRYNLPYPSMIEVARRWPTILEIHSDDKLEWEQRPRRYRTMGKLFRSFLFRQAAAMVMVDPQLLHSPGFPVDRLPSTAIPNGIRIPANLRYGGSRERKAGPPRLVLSVGNTESWQGIDKFIELAGRLPDLEFYLLGLDATQVPDHSANVTVQERLQPWEVTQFLSRMDIGMGNLALERISRPSPSPLKVREYIAAGLPCIVAHDDPDLDGKEGILNVGYGFTDFDQAGAAIGDFAARWTGRTCSLAMADSVSLAAKETERIAFFETILQEHSPRVLS
jgi:glycosyltransferase involved in cell wall biosynthesis